MLANSLVCNLVHINFIILSLFSNDLIITFKLASSDVRYSCCTKSLYSHKLKEFRKCRRRLMTYKNHGK